MASGSKARRAEEATLKAQALAAQQAAAAAAANAAKVDPFEESRRAAVTRHDDWRTGKLGPVDVRAMPDQIGMALFRDAKQSRDAGRIGRGLGTLDAGANPNYAASLDKEMGLERDLNASGMLEDYVTDKDAAVNQEMYGLIGASDTRSRYLANLYSDNARDADERLHKYRATKPPSFLRQLAMGLVGSAGAIGAAYAGKPPGAAGGGYLKDHLKRSPILPVGELGGEVIVNTAENGPYVVPHDVVEAVAGDDAGAAGALRAGAESPAVPLGGGSLPIWRRQRAAGSSAVPLGGGEVEDRPRFVVPDDAGLPAYRPPSPPPVVEVASTYATDEPSVTTRPGSLPYRDLPVYTPSRSADNAKGAAYHTEAQREQLARRAGELEADRNPRSKNSRGMSALKMAGLGALEGYAQDGLVGAIRGAGVRGVHAAISPNLDERHARDREIGRVNSQIGALDAREARRLKLEEGAADIRVKRANAQWLEAKPGIEAGKAAVSELNKQRAALLAQLGLVKGTELTPDHPLMREAQRLGFYVSAEDLNNSSSNFVPVELVDPQNPTTKRRGFYNKTTGELTDVGQSGYVQPVDAQTGMTPFQTGSLGLGRERLDVSIQSLALSTQKHLHDIEKYERELATGITASAKRAFDTDTAGLRTELSSTLSEVQKWQSMARENKLPPDVSMQRIAEAQQRVEALKGQIEAARSRALSTQGSRSAAPAGGGGGMFTEAEIRSRARAAGKDEGAAVAAARRAGKLR